MPVRIRLLFKRAALVLMLTRNLALLAMSTLGASLGSTVACGDAGEAPAGHADAGAVKALATDVTVDQVAIYQGVKVTLLEAGAPKVTLNAPVIPSRPALLRVHAQSSLTSLAPKDQFR